MRQSAAREPAAGPGARSSALCGNCATVESNNKALNRMCIVFPGRASRSSRRRFVISGRNLGGPRVALRRAQRGAGLRRLHFQPIGRIHRPALGGCRLSSRYRAARTSTGLARFRRGARTQRRRRRDYSDPRRLGQLHVARGDYPRAIEHLAARARRRADELCAGRCSAAARTTWAARTWPTTRRCSASPRSPTARGSRRAASALEATATLNALRALHETGAPVDPARLERVGDAVRALPATQPSADAPRARAAASRARAGAGFRLAAAARARARDRRARARRSRGRPGADRRGSCRARRGARGGGESRTGIGAHAPRRAHRARRGLGRAPVPLRVAARPRAPRQARRPDDALLAYESAVATLDGTTVGGGHFAPRVPPRCAAAVRGIRGLDARRAHAAAPAPMQRLRCATLQRNLEQLRIAEVRNYFENQCSVPIVFDRPPDIDRAVVIYPMLFADRLELLVSSGDDLTQITVPVSDAELTRTVRLLRDAIEQRRQRRRVSPARAAALRVAHRAVARPARASRAEHVGVRAGRAVANDPARRAPRRRSLPRSSATSSPRRRGCRSSARSTWSP